LSSDETSHDEDDGDDDDDSMNALPVSKKGMGSVVLQLESIICNEQQQQSYYYDGARDASSVSSSESL
jgi:hypothetical protein